MWACVAGVGVGGVGVTGCGCCLSAGGFVDQSGRDGGRSGDSRCTHHQPPIQSLPAGLLHERLSQVSQSVSQSVNKFISQSIS